MQWYADTLTGLVAHAAEIDAAVTRALRKSHGGDPHNAGHATYTSLDEDQLPRAMKLASLGEDASAGQRAELRRLWQSLSPEARAELWKARKDDLLAAGLLSPTVKQIAPDRGSGRHGAEEPTFTEFMTKDKMRMLASGSDWQGMNDASRHMQHYRENTGGTAGPARGQDAARRRGTPYPRRGGDPRETGRVAGKGAGGVPA